MFAFKFAVKLIHSILLLHYLRCLPLNWEYCTLYVVKHPFDVPLSFITRKPHRIRHHSEDLNTVVLFNWFTSRYLIINSILCIFYKVTMSKSTLYRILFKKCRPGLKADIFSVKYTHIFINFLRSLITFCFYLMYRVSK